ncbi:methyltransferase-like protein 27 [Pecten maximus]|uniref:methyltransferase-like protein 27 n=1 Tax=Pecten maximus TaxID=6579 RepID=UPI001458BF65|nr:methyltransferase-like protein 27 [Pecten maximus]XP_033757217.1 methyltransferase-like protein 27 [Pecten maximus]
MAEEKAKRFIQSSDVTDGQAYCANFGAHKPGMSMAEVAEYYSKWAEDYEHDLSQDRYLGPSFACKAVSEEYPLTTTDRKSIRILDVACGTGFLGEKLKEEGFTYVDGLDPSDKMLDVARTKDSYTNLYCEFMSDATLPIENDKYSCVVVAGGMGEGHIPCAAVTEMIRIVQPGGYVIIVMREEYLTHVQEYKGRLEECFLKFENDGKWKRCSREVVPKYSFDNNGVIFKFRVC